MPVWPLISNVKLYLRASDMAPASQAHVLDAADAGEGVPGSEAGLLRKCFPKHVRRRKDGGGGSKRSWYQRSEGSISLSLESLRTGIHSTPLVGPPASPLTSCPRPASPTGLSGETSASHGFTAESCFAFKYQLKCHLLPSWCNSAVEHQLSEPQNKHERDQV